MQSKECFFGSVLLSEFVEDNVGCYLEYYYLRQHHCLQKLNKRNPNLRTHCYLKKNH